MADDVVAPPHLRLAGVTAGYPSERPSWDRPVIGDLDLEVRAGELVTLLGANGSGKSCVLLATAGLVRSSAGTIEFAGQDLTRASATDRARAAFAGCWLRHRR